MDKNNILIIASALSLCSMLLFADNLEFVYASSVESITLPAGTPLQSVIIQSGTTSRTFITALVSGEINVYVKPTNIYSISSTLILTGASTGGAIVHSEFENEIVVFTNLGVHRIDINSNTLIQFISDGTFSGVTQAVYDGEQNRIYALKGSTFDIFDLDASNLSSYNTWDNASMTGLNVFLGDAIQFTIDANEGIMFLTNACTSSGTLKIDNLDGVWNEASCVDVSGAFQSWGIAVDTDLQKVIISVSDGASLRYTDYSLSLLGSPVVDAVPRYIAVDSETNRVYVQHSTLDQVTILSTVDGTNIQELAICDNPINPMNYQNVKSTLESGTFVIIPCTTGQVISFLIDTSGSSGGNIVNGVDCDDPLKAQTLLCRNQSSNGVSLPSQLLNQSSTTIFCQTGIIQCTDNGNGGFTPVNPDSKTNGVGFIMTLIGLGIMVGILWVASRGDLSSIPTFVWFIVTIAVLGAMTALQYVDPTFLIIGVVSIVGFAVAKAKGIFSGGAVFNGEGS